MEEDDTKFKLEIYILNDFTYEKPAGIFGSNDKKINLDKLEKPWFFSDTLTNRSPSKKVIVK